NAYLIPQLAWSDLFCSLYTFVDIILLAFSIPYSSIQYLVNALDPSYFRVAPAAERYYPNLRPFVHLRKANITFEQRYRYGLPIYRYGLLLAFLGSVGMTTHHWTAAIKYSSNNASISCTSNALGIHHPLISKLFILPTHFFLLAICLVIPSTVFIYCYSHVIYHVWFNAEENKATNTALLKSRRKLTKLFIILTVTIKANRETVCEKRTDNKLRADLFIACSHRFDGESIIYAFRCPRFRHEAIKILPCFCCKKEELRPNSLSGNRVGLQQTASV
ncbi:unnamed protein product, partial [Pocillopora meandrina]